MKNVLSAYGCENRGFDGNTYDLVRFRVSLLLKSSARKYDAYKRFFLTNWLLGERHGKERFETHFPKHAGGPITFTVGIVVKFFSTLSEAASI